MMASLSYLPFLFAFIISTAITYMTIVGYRKLGIVDKSTKKQHPKHIHSKPVPRGGGIPIFIAIFITTLIFGSFDSHMAAIFLGAIILMILGILDDIMDLSPYLRLIFGVIVAGIVVYSGIGISYVSNPFGGPPIVFHNLWIADLVAMVWIVWGMNFVNMGAKGLDGQLPGIVVIAAIVMGILSNRFSSDIVTWSSSFLAFAVAGAYGGLLIFNIYPQKIMPGWGGGAQAGYFLAVLSILSGSKLATALIVLGIPLMDVVYAIIRRVRAGRSPVWGDDEHLHHQLLKLGLSKTQVAMLYWIFTALLGTIALQLNSQMKIYTILLIFVSVGGVLLWINSLLSSNRRG